MVPREEIYADIQQTDVGMPIGAPNFMPQDRQGRPGRELNVGLSVLNICFQHGRNDRLFNEISLDPIFLTGLAAGS